MKLISNRRLQRGVLRMNSKARRTDLILCLLFVLSLLLYILACKSCFKNLPIDCPTWHIRLVLFFQFIPMFFLQLLLCRKTQIFFRVLIPIGLAILVGVVFFYTIDWHIVGWIFFLVWSIAYFAGCCLGWITWFVGRILVRGKDQM